MISLTSCLLLSAFLFAIGLAGALMRRNAILVLIGIELMLNAANLNFIAFWRYGPHPEALTGMMFVIFSIGVAAAEAAVGLALIISLYRHTKTTNIEEVNSYERMKDRKASSHRSFDAGFPFQRERKSRDLQQHVIFSETT